MPKKSQTKSESVSEKKLDSTIQKTTESASENAKPNSDLRISSLRLQNIGPFDEVGLTVNFGKKLNAKKANVHIFVGENGCGKSTIANSFDMILNYAKVLENGNFDIRLDYDRKSKIELSLNSRVVVLEARSSLDIPPIIFHNELPDLKIFAYSPANFYLKSIAKSNPNSGVSFNKKKSILDPVESQNIAEWAQNLDYETRLGIDIEKRRTALETSLQKINEILEKKFEWGYSVEKRIYLPKLKDSFINFSSLSDGHKATLSLFSDLLFRVYDNFKEMNNFLEAQFVLILDEIDIHLHPKAQRRILPAIQSLFPNAEIFCTTHSPFVVNSVSDAWVYELSMKDGKYVDDQTGEILDEIGCADEKHEHYLENYKNRRVSSTADSIGYSLLEDFGVSAEYGEETQLELNQFFEIVRLAKQGLEYDKNKLNELIENLKNSSEEIKEIVSFEARKLK